MATVTKLNLTFKILRVLLMIGSFFIESILYELVFWIAGEKEKTKFQMRANKLSRYSRAMMKAFGMTWAQTVPLLHLRPGLIVCNHQSYLDIFALAAIAPGLFVTSVEVRNQSWLGSLCKIAGCLFVERRSRSGLSKEIRAIDLVLTLGTSVVVFPEATSTAGEDVLPFKAALYQAAIDAQVSIHHFCIRYEQPQIPYVDKMTIGPHLQQVLKLEKIPVHLRFLGSFNEPLPHTRYEMAKQSHQLIQHAYHSL